MPLLSPRCSGPRWIDLLHHPTSELARLAQHTQEKAKHERNNKNNYALEAMCTVYGQAGWAAMLRNR
jgi:hypothetical protein